MHQGITAMIVGTGNFGRNYLAILSELQQHPPPGVPSINKIVLTRTRQTDARTMADQWHAQNPALKCAVVGAGVRDVAQLAAQLEHLRPQLICITARDRQCGDDIHAAYARLALSHGAVFCEKNLAHADGDGASVARCESLGAHSQRARFGLDLPMAVVSRELATVRAWRQALARTSQIHFHWEMPHPSATGLIRELALHPWSMLPADWRVTVQSARMQTNRAKIGLVLQTADTNRTIACTIHLRTGGRWRGVRLDNWAGHFVFADGRLKVLTGDIRTSTTTRKDTVLTLENPIKQQIVALLRDTPVVGLTHAMQSQRFIEDVLQAAHN